MARSASIQAARRNPCAELGLKALKQLMIFNAARSKALKQLMIFNAARS
jgi:hypothetical protein